jgi:hypothetical protein
VLPNFGVQFQNKVSGYYRLGEAEERPLTLALTGKVTNALEALFNARVALNGTISLDGYADEKPVTGELQVQPLRRMRLDLSFADNQGAACKLEATKEFELPDAVNARAELAGELRGEGGAALGRVRLEVDLMASFSQFWSSLRPT